VGLACRDGMFLDRRQVEKTDCAHWKAQQRLLMNRNVTAGVFENDGAMILAEGLAYDRCQIGVVTDLDNAAAMQAFYIDSPEQIFNVLRTQVDVVLPSGAAILNADDALVAEMASLCDGEVIFFGQDLEAPALLTHRARGARAVVLRDGSVVLLHGAEEKNLVTLSKLSQSKKGAPEYFATSVLVAVASAWALGIDMDLVRAGLETFELSQAIPLSEIRGYKRTTR